MSLQAQYQTTTPAFKLTTAPTSGYTLSDTDPSAAGSRPIACLLQATTQNIRWTVDGSAPTSTVGMVLVAGSDPFYYFGPLDKLRFIQAASGAVLNVIYCDINDAQGPEGPPGPAGPTGIVATIQPAGHIAVDATDPANPVVYLPLPIQNDGTTIKITDYDSATIQRYDGQTVFGLDNQDQPFTQGSNAGTPQGRWGFDPSGNPMVVNNDTWTWPGGDGTAGDVLTTNGAGSLSFAPAGGGSSPIQSATVTATGNSLPFPPLVSIAGVGVTLSGIFVKSSGAAILSVPNFPEDILTLSFPNTTGILGDLNLESAHGVGLTTLEFPLLIVVSGKISIPNDYTVLENVDISALQAVGGDFSVILPALSTFDLSALIFVGGDFFPQIALLTSLGADNLTDIAGTFDPSQMPSCETLSFPTLARVGSGFNLDTLPALTSVDFSSLQSVGTNISSADVGDITILSLPSLVRVGGNIEFDVGIEALETFSIGSTLKSVGGSVVINSALNEGSVDNVLVRLASLDGTNGTTSYDNQTVTIGGTSSPPSATGLAAKATLEGRGNTVSVN